MDEKFHIGRLIKSVFDEKNMSVSEFARQIHCERTNVYTIFDRPSIDIDLLARISKVLEHNFFEEVMREYGLTHQFSPQLNIQIDLEECSKDDADMLLQSISTLVAQQQMGWFSSCYVMFNHSFRDLLQRNIIKR